MLVTETNRRFFIMLKEGINGFCMALADSVPGVSGGTVAFIMGFYDRFIGAIHALVFSGWKEKKEAVRYLWKLGLGWIIGMGMAVLVLTSLFESHIYVVSSLFLGFVAGSIPLVIRDEKESFRQVGQGIFFGVLGMLLVVLISYLNGRTTGAAMDLGQFSISLGIRLFFIGMIAISAMFLPGISGSTLLLIFGAYMPVMHAIRSLLSLQFSYLPAVMCFGLGIVCGAATVVKLIRYCLQHFRVFSVYAILGMMIGSFYAICMGPTTLSIPQLPLALSSFHPVACVIGIALVLSLQLLKDRDEKKAERA